MNFKRLVCSSLVAMILFGSGFGFAQDNFVDKLNSLQNNFSKILQKKKSALNDPAIRQNIDKKKEELAQMLKAKKQEIEQAASSQAKQFIYDQSRKLSTLKTYAASIEYTYIKDQLKGLKTIEIQKAFDSFVAGVIKNDNIKVYIKTNSSEKQVNSQITYYDTGASAKMILEPNSGINIMEVSLPTDGLIGQEFFSGLEQGYMPNKLLSNYEVITPVIYKVEQVDLVGELMQAMWGVKAIGADLYQNKLEKGNQVIVGVLDTGIDITHPDLKSNIYKNSSEIPNNNIDDDKNGYIDDVNGYDFVANNPTIYDKFGHGTHVAGVIGAVVNGVGIFGVNSFTKVMPLKVLGDNGYGTNYDIMDGLLYAINNGAKVVNMSLGGQMGQAGNELCQLIDYAKSKGVSVVVAAGNSATDASSFTPANCKNAITVGAVDQNYNLASFSNYGQDVDVSAPGVDIYSTTPNNSYLRKSGTSMASPFVAGIVSAILTMDPTKTVDQITDMIKSNLDPIKNISSSKPIGNVVNMKKIFESIGLTGTTQTITGTIDKSVYQCSALIDTCIAGGYDLTKCVVIYKKCNEVSNKLGKANNDLAPKLAKLKEFFIKIQQKAKIVKDKVVEKSTEVKTKLQPGIDKVTQKAEEIKKKAEQDLNQTKDKLQNGVNNFLNKFK